jgi:hypothetical protein
MEKHGDEIDISEEEASGGEKPRIVRYILGISLFLAVAALSIIWITGALVTPG